MLTLIEKAATAGWGFQKVIAILSHFAPSQSTIGVVSIVRTPPAQLLHRVVDATTAANCL